MDEKRNLLQRKNSGTRGCNWKTNELKFEWFWKYKLTEYLNLRINETDKKSIKYEKRIRWV